MISEKLMEMDADERFWWILEHPDDQQMLRKEYLALDDQGRADLLCRLRVGGAAFGLAPNQYPEAEPHREVLKESNNSIPMCDGCKYAWRGRGV